ncbi:MAG: hypothetical protein ACREOC_04420 [Gemmatimonadales bacterium]
MFLVEPESGQRCQYGSAGALSAAIRRGELGPRARIFHRTTQRWLPITVHPEYRRAESAREETSARQWRERPWTFLAERPVEEAPADTFQPIPARSSSTLVLIPGGSEPSWLGSALRQLLRLGRLG